MKKLKRKVKIRLNRRKVILQLVMRKKAMMLKARLHPMMESKSLKKFSEKLQLKKRKKQKHLQLLRLVHLSDLSHRKKTNTRKMSYVKLKSLKHKVMNSLNHQNMKKQSNNIQKLFSVMFLPARKLSIIVTEPWLALKPKTTRWLFLMPKMRSNRTLLMLKLTTDSVPQIWQ